jgi:hypothetical protein
VVSLAKNQRGKAKGGSEAGPRVVEIDRALLNAHPSGAIPLRALPYLGDERTPGKVRVQLAVDVDEGALVSPAPGQASRATLHLTVQATHRDSGTSLRDDKRLAVSVPASRRPGWATFHHDLDLVPGVVQVRLVVRDESSRRMGAVTARFEVPALGSLRVATPILSDELREPAQKGVRPQLTVPARRAFRSTAEMLFCQIQVLGARPSPEGPPQVEAAYLLRREDGTEVRRTPPSLISAAAGGPVLRLVGLPLKGLSEGDYELVLSARDRSTGQEVEHVEPFRLEPDAGR